MNTRNPTAKAGVKAHCGACNKVEVVPPGVIGKAHRGKANKKIRNACKGTWLAGL